MNENPYKNEYYDGEIFPMGELESDLPEAMAGAKPVHNTIVENLSVDIGSKIKKTSCRPFSKDQRIYIPSSGLYTYPDYLVVCGPLQYSDIHNDTITNPVLIIEVLSKKR